MERMPGDVFLMSSLGSYMKETLKIKPYCTVSTTIFSIVTVNLQIVLCSSSSKVSMLT